MNPVMHSLYSLQKAHLEYSYPCDIIDTGQGCKPMNLGCKPLVWWELPLGNHLGTDRGPLPYLVGNSLSVVMGYPTGQGIQLPG